MRQRQTNTRLTADMVGRGMSGLILFGSGATAIAVTGWWIMEPGDAGISFPGFIMLFLVVCIPSTIVWALGAAFLGLPIWAVFHALGLRGWLAVVAGGAGLVGPIWFLATHDWTAGAAGALTGAAAGWGLWWMAYRHGEAAR